MNNNQEEIKSIKVAQRELADRLEALELIEDQPKREPQCGDVWKGKTAHRIALIADGGKVLQQSDGLVFDLYPTFPSLYEYLGTFDEVYVLRSEAPVRDDLRQKLLDWRDCEGDGILMTDDCDYCDPHEVDLLDYLRDVLA
jgi:hypothetical protein